MRAMNATRALESGKIYDCPCGVHRPHGYALWKPAFDLAATQPVRRLDSCTEGGWDSSYGFRRVRGRAGRSLGDLRAIDLAACAGGLILNLRAPHHGPLSLP